MIFWEKNNIWKDLNETIPIVKEFKKRCFRKDSFDHLLDVLQFMIEESETFFDKRSDIRVDNLLHEKNIPNFFINRGFRI